ncbi:MAG: phosphoglycerate dehydrogenase [Deltaproteobacteria bacterium]|nr:phosphoglycerate dehydrogenase [Deltaproteobacteria bacterium]
MIHKILISDGLAVPGLEKLKQTSELEILEFATLEREKLKALLPTVDILIVRSRTKVDADLLGDAKSLKLVIRAGIGLDNVNVEAATERGIVVMNAPTGNIVTTAEHTLAMIFAISRHISQADASIRAGRWEKSKFQGNELRGKTLGVVGLGNIGKAVAERAIALGLRVVAYDPFLSAEAAAKRNIRLITLEELLRESDYVTIHVPLIQGTKHLINRQALGMMKPSAYLINCARGGIVDEQALLEALDKQQIAGCALDVFEKEPIPSDHPLLRRSDVVLTPHLGASTDEAQTQVSLEVADQVIQYVREGVLKNAINVPNVSGEQLEVLKPYLRLSERLGAFSAQIAPANIRKLRVHFEGAVSSLNKEVLTLSVLKGFLTPILATTVNFVNVRKLLKERGIRVEESFDPECAEYSSLIKVIVEGKDTLTCAGTIFGREEPRIVSIDSYNIDAIAEGHLLFIKNADQPGVIGAMGSVLGNSGINIARMHLGRDSEKGRAIAVINVDSKVHESILEQLGRIPGMLSVTSIHLQGE